jgi:CheY-like chemotaxis protein
MVPLDHERERAAESRRGPATPAPTAPSKRRRSLDRKPSGNSMTNAPNVLLVDQDDVLRQATALLLAHRGAGVSPAATLEEAISLSRKRVHDVALIDISPSMLGAPELLRRLQREGLVPQRIVLSTSVPLSREEAGSFSQVLIKPYPFDQLMTAIFGEAAAGAELQRAPARAPRGARPPRAAAAMPRTPPPAVEQPEPRAASTWVLLRLRRHAGKARLAGRTDLEGRARSARRGWRAGRAWVAGGRARARRVLRSPRRAARGRPHPG